ncbi:MAG: hypothetical protein K2W95_13805 [Candidatus Obscuribacterales bacterium]|nr:hypothetical protein [Candidatus Obscuribacterales bacterium]
MKALARLFIIAALSTLSPCNAQQAPADDQIRSGADAYAKTPDSKISGKRQKLKFERLSIELTPPKSYTLKEIDNPGHPGKMFSFTGDRRPDGTASSITITVMPDDKVTEGKNPEIVGAVVAGMLSPWRTRTAGYTETPVSISMGKSTADGASFSGTLQSNSLKGIVAATTSGKAIWAVSAIDTAVNFDTTEAVLRQLLSGCAIGN